ncbi:CotH kinase family protein [Gordonia sp. PKS22-38]|uniref:CotH kinase family protein n=1 Tax=Gordonia prachuapensis TaxID=3115651 RepID=A0ABU7MQT8_9ACTN|nr:CotH kinase family protein [Gordonia sp. PKS22-38]
MTIEQQQALDALYAIDNVLTIRISLPAAEWEAVRNQQPKGGVCNFDWTGGARYTWHRASSVEISGTRFPAKTTFTDVGIKKKSFCGSISSSKPSLHIDFGKDNRPNRPLIEGLIGSRYITLNNSVQDRSFIRQPLGYKLFELAGLPRSRCNFARVFVNGKPVGQGLPNVNGPGVYVSVEPIMPRYIERNFGDRNGNLYELEHEDDFIDARFDRISVEDLSEFDDKADLRLAIDRITTNGLAGAAEVVDLDQFIRCYAMDFFLKHWDGYSRNTNNTYIFNDVDAVANPGVDNVNFRMVPWGLDQILQSHRHFTLGDDGLLAKLVRKDPDRREQLMDQIRSWRVGIFGRETQQSQLIPMIDTMEDILGGLRVPNLPTEIGAVRKQLRLAGSAGHLLGGLPNASVPVYIRDDATNECMRTTQEGIPADAPDPANFEVVHRPRPTIVEDEYLWSFTDLGTGKSLVNKATGHVLHASRAFATAAGQKLLYTCAGDNTDHADEFEVRPVDTPDEYTHSGYFTLVSVRTGAAATFGTDKTPTGARRVHQSPTGSTLFFS